MKIKISVRTNKVGSRVEETVEIPDEEMEGMTEEERANHVEEFARNEMFQMIDWNWEEQ